MSHFHPHARRDATHKAVVMALRAIGCSVVDLGGVGDGVPDLLVGRNGRSWLLEVKSLKGRVNPLQATWAARWRGPKVRVVHDAAEAVAVVGRLA